MAYTADTLGLVYQPTGGTVARVFIYSSTDADGSITGSGYFSDGVAKGMRVGDLVQAVNAVAAKYKLYQATVIATGAVTVAAPTAIT
jgi:hypothetical protein